MWTAQEYCDITTSGEREHQSGTIFCSTSTLSNVSTDVTKLNLGQLHLHLCPSELHKNCQDLNGKTHEERRVGRDCQKVKRIKSPALTNRLHLAFVSVRTPLLACRENIRRLMDLKCTM